VSILYVKVVEAEIYFLFFPLQLQNILLAEFVLVGNGVLINEMVLLFLQ